MRKNERTIVRRVVNVILCTKYCVELDGWPMLLNGAYRIIIKRKHISIVRRIRSVLGGALICIVLRSN